MKTINNQRFFKTNSFKKDVVLSTSQKLLGDFDHSQVAEVFFALVDAYKKLNDKELDGFLETASLIEYRSVSLKNEGENVNVGPDANSTEKKSFNEAVFKFVYNAIGLYLTSVGEFVNFTSNETKKIVRDLITDENIQDFVQLAETLRYTGSDMYAKAQVVFQLIKKCYELGAITKIIVNNAKANPSNPNSGAVCLMVYFQSESIFANEDSNVVREISNLHVLLTEVVYSALNVYDY